MNIFLFDFHFHLVESFSIDTDDGALAYEGIGVDDFDDAEDGYTLVLLGQNTEYLHLVASVPAMAVEDCYAMIHLCADGIGYLLIFLAEYHELHTLSLGIHHIVEHQVLYHHGTETEYHLSDGIYRREFRFRIEDEEGTAHDDEVHEDEHTSQRDVMVFVHDGGDDIRSSRTSIVQEDDGERQACKQTADDERHEVLSLSQHLHHLAVFTYHPVLRQRQEHGEHDDGVDGLHHELESQDLQRGKQQGGIDEKIRQIDRYPRAVVNHGCDTRYATRYYLVWKQENGPSKCVKQESKGNVEIILALILNCLTDCYLHNIFLVFLKRRRSPIFR